MGRSVRRVQRSPLKRTKRHILPMTIYEFHSDVSLLRQSERAVRAQRWISNSNNSSSAGSLDHLPAFGKLHRWFGRCLDAVRTDLDLPFEELVITQSWANKAMAGEVHHGHVHQNSYLSGIFYLTTGKTGPTEFYRNDDWFDFFLLDDPDIARTVSFTSYPKAGKLLLFPSSLDHCVAEHRSEEPRYTISFNTFPRGTIGGGAGSRRYLNLEVLPYGRAARASSSSPTQRRAQ